MVRTFTIIDSFSVSKVFRERGNDLPLGTWFVVDGHFESTAELPRIGAPVVIIPPEGEGVHTSIAYAEVRHGSGAVSFVPALEHLPRLSTFSVAEHGL